MLLSTTADKRFAFANSKLDLELSRTLEHLNIEHKEQMLVIDYDRRQFQKKLEIFNAKKRQIQKDKRQTLIRSQSATSILSRPKMKSFTCEKSNEMLSKSRSMLSQGISSTPSRWANRALSAPNVFPTDSSLPKEFKSIGSRFSAKTKTANNKQLPAKAGYRGRPITHPAGTPRQNAYREISDTSDTRKVKLNIRPARYMDLKRRMSVPVARDGHNWDVKSELSVESD